MKPYPPSEEKREGSFPPVFPQGGGRLKQYPGSILLDELLLEEMMRFIICKP